MNNINNIMLYNKGVYNKNTTCKVIQHDLGNSGCFYIKECDKNDINSIEVIKLDDIIDNNSKVDFIKIDTEGSELQVLEGAINLISTYKPLIQVETNQCSGKYFGYNKERIHEFMKQHDYKIFDDDGNNPLFICK
jgi:FkbM family methyltransferase